MHVIVIALSILYSCTDFQETGNLASFSVDTKELSFSSGGDSRSLIVSSGTKWDVSDMPQWLTLQSISQSGHPHFEWSAVFLAMANEEYNREGSIIIIAGAETAVVTVSQNGSKGRYIAVESVSISPTGLTLKEGEQALLSLTIIPSNASVKSVIWKSSSPSIATVSTSGLIDAVSAGIAQITATTEDGNKTATCIVNVTPISSTGIYEYVEMGDGLKWATCNVGANYPWDYGDYYAWGEIETYYVAIADDEDGTITCKEGKESGFSWASYKFNPSGDGKTFTKYTGSDYRTLLIEDDAANKNWGGTWRLPTADEWAWLIANCTWTWTYDYNNTGVRGRIVSSNVAGYEGNTIFLPASGGYSSYFNGGLDYCGRYWASTLSDPSMNGCTVANAYRLCFDSTSLYYTGISYSNCGRYTGYSVRPVSN